jgi:formate dehydrogenase subunit gamma
MPEHTPWNPETAKELIAAKVGLDGPLMPILHALNETFGHVPDEAVPLLADALNISRAEVHGTLTFYHDFRREPAPRHVVKLCRAEACQARGAASLAAHAEQRLGTGMAPHGHANAAGPSSSQSWALEPIYCLGLCASGPAALIDGRPHARLSPERFDALIAETTSCR